MTYSCENQRIITTMLYTPAYSHEQIASLCLQSELFGGEDGFTRAEGEWAQSEVGEGVEEVWERAVRPDRKKISGGADRLSGIQLVDSF